MENCVICQSDHAVGLATQGLRTETVRRALTVSQTLGRYRSAVGLQTAWPMAQKTLNMFVLSSKETRPSSQHTSDMHVEDAQPNNKPELKDQPNETVVSTEQPMQASKPKKVVPLAELFKRPQANKGVKRKAPENDTAAQGAAVADNDSAQAAKITEQPAIEVTAVAGIGGSSSSQATTNTSNTPVCDESKIGHVDLEALAATNLAICKERVQAAAASGSILPLQDLLLEPSWTKALQAELTKSYFKKLSDFVHKEYQNGTVYPPREMVFRAMNSCPLEQVRVVILGQDPYPNAGQAMGLCFSVNKGVRVPQSLIKIYQELKDDLGCPVPKHGDLSSWSTQGVLMLNTLLTVRATKAASHKGQGWETFTDAAITAISKYRKGVVFLLWGKPAQLKAKLVDTSKHRVLTAPHPSPLAAASGQLFVGCKHFSKANALLEEQGLPPVNWCIK